MVVATPTKQHPVVEPIIEVEPITKMKPSEALRLGAMSIKQLYGDLYHLNKDRKVDAGCALGMIGFSYGDMGRQHKSKQVYWPVTHRTPGGRIPRVAKDSLPTYTYSEDGGYCSTKWVHASVQPSSTSSMTSSSYFRKMVSGKVAITEAVLHLNDEHHLTAPQIADWLESVGY